MTLMGAVRELTRKYFHVFNLQFDFTPESFTPTLAYSSWVFTGVTLTFYIIDREADDDVKSQRDAGEHPTGICQRGRERFRREIVLRSEERRVGKEGRSRWSPY